MMIRRLLPVVAGLCLASVLVLVCVLAYGADAPPVAAPVAAPAGAAVLPLAVAAPGVTPPAGQVTPPVGAPGALATDATAAPAAAVPAPAPFTLPPAKSGPAELRFNFQNAPLAAVLEYLSQAGNFVVLQDTPATGNVTMLSEQPLNADEAVALLHTVLNDHGYGLIRRERVLRIVKNGEAKTRDLPVVCGNDPAAVPKTDEVVTQIIPVRHTTAAKMVDTLRTLMPAQATLAVNEDSNALVLTDTRINIRHLMEIMQALDTAVASILDVKVVALRYADATDTAAVINKVFTPPTAASRNGQGGAANAFQFFGRMRGGFGGGGGGGDNGGGQPENPANDARQTASYVAATADQRANAVIITAPTEMLPQVEDLVAQLDVPSEATSTLKVFPLHFADATELANVIAGLYPSTSTTAARNAQGNNRFGGRGFMPPQPQTPATEKSDRKLAEATVVAVADTRTNSVIVSASPTTMANIEGVIRELDATPANVPGVYVYRLENANVTQAKAILESMFEKLPGTTTTSSSATSTTRRTGTTTNTNSNSSNSRSNAGSGSSSSLGNNSGR